MHISDLSSDVCSSDLEEGDDRLRAPPEKVAPQGIERWAPLEQKAGKCHSERFLAARIGLGTAEEIYQEAEGAKKCLHYWIEGGRAEVYQIDEIGRHTSELQSLMRISYAVFCLKKK